jgi:anion-transporting  ArsA/GET3 family ATPase
VTARLHVLLGAGGVGKTTLAAGYALALARAGRRVGLLGIDPARRLQTALGIELADAEATVPDAGELRAAVLSPGEALRRWVLESVPDPDVRARLLVNTFFLALAERLATANDVFAAIRVAEWAEHDPALDDLVVDTAPGFNAIEFLRRPEALSAFLEGPLVSWMRRFARAQRHGLAGEALRGVAQRVLGGLARIGGTDMLVELADFLALAEDAFGRMATRLADARRWLADPSTDLLLVTTVRDDAAEMAGGMARALASLDLSPRATLVNRTFAPELGAELDALGPVSLSPESAAVVRYARAQLALQARVVEAVAPLAPAIASLPASRSFEGDARRGALLALGERVREVLDQRERPTAKSRE